VQFERLSLITMFFLLAKGEFLLESCKNIIYIN
jgi:hypothetical protein